MNYKMIDLPNRFKRRYLDLIFTILIAITMGVNIFIYLSPNKRYINAAYFFYAIIFDSFFKAKFNENYQIVFFLAYVLLNISILIILYTIIRKIYFSDNEKDSRIKFMQVIILGLIPLVLYSIFQFVIFDSNQMGL
jgi:hypothetical protein